MLKICTLGTLELWYGENPLPVPPTIKSRSLLAYLVVHRNRPQPRDRLADLFWGDRPEYKARHSLATALWHIRRCLPEDYILSDIQTVQFDPQASVWLDVGEFESCSSGDDIPRLQSAMALYRGDFLDGFYDDWIINERYRLEALFTQALARLMVAHESEADHEAALHTALRLLEHNPLREDAHRLAMLAYCRLGLRDAALAQYRRCREIVRGELDAEPMRETTELYQAILRGRLEVGSKPEIPSTGVAAVEPVPASGQNPLDVATASPLVGRQDELAFLNECWQGAEAGQARLILINGEAGVGKTRLVQEFANHLSWQGARLLWGRCYEFERILPYQPIAEALRMVLPGLTEVEVVNLPSWIPIEVARLVPEISERYPNLAVPDPRWSDQEQAKLSEGVARFLSHLSSQGALLLVLEDLHWASESTLGLTHYLVRHLVGRPVQIVGTFREEAVGASHPLRALERQLSREQLAKSLRLSRLSQVAVETLVVSMSGVGEAVKPLAVRLYQETEGNPFFLMEIVKALFETGIFHLEGGAWEGDFARLSEGELPLPTGVSEAIWTRVQALNDDAQEALRMAAVLGREFDFNLLNAAWRRGEEATLEALDLLLRRRLIEEGTGLLGRDYAFTHHKIQEVIYANIPHRHRRHAHARVGTAMERLCGSQLDEVVGELAFHYEQGRQHDKKLTRKAIACLHQAGDHARGLYAHRDAIDYYERALALLKEQGDHERAARTLMKLGLTYHTAFDFRRARHAYEEGFTLWQQVASIERAVPPPPAPHALRTHWQDPATLDPGLADTMVSVDLVRKLFSGLVGLTPDIDVVPDVARTWEVLDGGRRYLFHLRDDVHWNDGAPVTAYDFEYAWKRVLDPVTGSTIADLLYEIKGAEAFHHGEVSDPDAVGVLALNESTLAVELEGPTGYFLYLLANCVTYPVPRHAVETFGEDWTRMGNIVTNGPFKMEAWQRGESMVLARYPGYHGRFGGNVQRVELTLLSVPKMSTAWERYEADELDILNLRDLPPAERDSARHRHPGEYVRVPRLSTCYVWFDWRRPPFDDVRVRRAFVLAADRETLADVALRGYELPATGGFVPPGMPGHSPGIGLPYDPDQARYLLAETGFRGGGGFPPVEALAVRARLPHIRYLQAQWRENLGVEISWEPVDKSPMGDRLQCQPPHMSSTAWLADYPDPDNFLRSSTVPWSIGWGNETCETLVEEARRVTDQQDRIKLYGQAERILLEEARIMPLTYEPSHELVKPWVSRYPTSVMGVRFWKDAIIEPH